MRKCITHNTCDFLEDKIDSLLKTIENLEDKLYTSTREKDETIYLLKEEIDHARKTRNE